MSEGQITVERGERIWRLCLDNPARRNAMTAAMWDQLASACAEAEGAGARVLMVYGAERTFCAGASIDAFETDRANPAGAQGYDDRVEACCRALEAVNMPTLALIQGACAGAGLSIAASCDLRLAASDALLLMPAARLGLGYDPRGLTRLRAVFGPGLTRELLATAEKLSAERAHTLGAIQRLSAPDIAGTDADALAESIAANAPLTLAAAKHALRALERPLDPDLWSNAWRSLDRADASEDYVEGRRAFRERRDPKFQGR